MRGAGRQMRLAVFAGAAALLGACGDNADITIPDDGIQPPATGYYAGTWISNVRGIVADGVALVSTDGEVRFIGGKSGAQFVFDLPDGADTSRLALTGFASPFRTFPDGSSQCVGTVDLTLIPAAELFGTFQCGGDHGTFSLEYNDNLSYATSNLAYLPGILEATLPPTTILTLVVQPDGRYSGQDTAGCDYTGSFSIQDVIFNVYGMTLDRTCHGATVRLKGLASLGRDRASGADALFYGVSDANLSLAGVLVYQ